MERVGGCRGDEPAYFDRMARGARNPSARRRTWIASGKSRCIRGSGLPLSPPLLTASALGPLRRRLPMPASASRFPACMPNTRITLIRQATILIIRRRPQLTPQPPASSAGRARITGAIGVRRSGNDVASVAVSGPRGVKAWPQLFLGWRSLRSRYGLTPSFPGTLAECFLTRPELLRSSIARRRIWIIWRWWWIDRRCLQAGQLLLVQLSGDIAA